MGWKPSPAPVFLYIANVSGKIRASDMLMNLLLKGTRGTCIFVLSLSPPLPPKSQPCRQLPCSAQVLDGFFSVFL